MRKNPAAEAVAAPAAKDDRRTLHRYPIPLSPVSSPPLYLPPRRRFAPPETKTTDHSPEPTILLFPKMDISIWADNGLVERVAPHGPHCTRPSLLISHCERKEIVSLPDKVTGRVGDGRNACKARLQRTKCRRRRRRSLPSRSRNPSST